MNEKLNAIFIICFFVAISAIVIVGDHTSWNFDIEKANSNYKMEQEKMKTDYDHLVVLFQESKTTTDCEVLKNIRLEMLSLDSPYYKNVRNNIKEMAKERQEILCP